MEPNVCSSNKHDDIGSDNPTATVAAIGKMILTSHRPSAKECATSDSPSFTLKQTPNLVQPYHPWSTSTDDQVHVYIYFHALNLHKYNNIILVYCVMCDSGAWVHRMFDT